MWIFSLLFFYTDQNESDDTCWWLKTTTSAANGKSQILLNGSREFRLHNLWAANPVDYLSPCLNFYLSVTACGYLVICLSTSKSDGSCWWLKTTTSAASGKWQILLYRFLRIPPSHFVVYQPCRLSFSLSEFLSNCHGVWIFGFLFFYVDPNESDDTCCWLKTTTSAANEKSQIILYGTREFHFHNLWSANPVDYLSCCLIFYPTSPACGYFHGDMPNLPN